MEATCKTVEVKDYPRILETFGRINKDIVRPKLEALLDNYEKVHNISHNKVEDVCATKSSGTGENSTDK
jgi:hypothetical protein